MLILFLFSLSAVVWFYAGGASSHYVISSDEVQYRYIDDKGVGGNTLGAVTQNADKSVTLGCQLGEKHRWPYCEVAISLSDDIRDGIDLTHYHSMVIEGSYLAPQRDQRLRVYLRNYNEAYSSVDDPVSLKFNGLEYNPTLENSEVALPLKAFQVLSWWISDLAVPLEHAGSELTNVSVIEIATGSAPVIGEHRLNIESIRFEGVMISEAQLFKNLTFMWLVAALIVLCVKYWQSLKVYKEERVRSARLLAINEQLKQQSETLSIMATTDPLTGLRNRMNVHRDLEQTMSRKARRECTALVIDIDHFKRINDTFGHEMGDRILIDVATLLKNRSMSTDIAVRWGGEEFVFFCPDRNLAQASFLAEKIRSRFEDNAWPHGETMTCSIGVALLRNDSVAGMLADADDALYQAKQSGRNRVEVYSDVLVTA
ncbi:GGDEF domain-containing protein [Enterovibrio norvegicus]|uniref:GGDEF domain-containing protein n=1 Tax=Enterovibrio norvegicus TaxID=188144 RepID=UPI0024B16691|nr:GGDEF domain-containing protein [Enterovibrio norvegicus]